LKNQELITKTIILTSGIFIFSFFFLNSYIRFDSYKKYALFGKIEEIKKARVGNVFRFEFSAEFYSLHIKNRNELKVGDSISKYPFAKKIDVFRNENNKMEFYKSFKIEDGLYGE
jgi:hypothetical protein